MTWVGLRDTREAVLAPAGLGQSCARPPAPDTVLAKGTLWVEYRHEAAERPVNIIRYTRRDPQPVVVTLRSDPDGTLALLLRQGGRDALHMLALPGLIPGEALTACYQWDSGSGCGVFAVMRASTGETVLTEIGPESGETVLPLTWRDGAHLMADRGGCQTAPGFDMAALATHLAPIGPAPVLCGSGQVPVAGGTARIRDLRIGDTVLAADGLPAQIRWIGAATLPARGLNAPHLMRAPYLGVGPDLCLGGGASLRLTGTEVEYLFGEAQVAVTLRDLADRVAILPLAPTGPGTRVSPAPPTRIFHHIVLDRPAALSVSGAVVEQLAVGDILGSAALHRWSMLKALPGELLPRHDTAPCPRLRDYEAQTLRQMQAA